MSHLTEKQLISKIQSLKEIKPRNEWVTLTKAQLFAEVQPTAQKATFANVLSSLFANRRAAYSLAAFAFVLVGLIGFAKDTVPGDALFPLKKIAEQSTAALSFETPLKQNVETLHNRINDLAKVAKSGNKDNISSAVKEVKDNAKELADALKNKPADSSTLKELAVSLKTLADVKGTDVTANADVADLYQTVVKAQIDELEKATLTDEQATILASAKDLYAEGKYTDALEILLTINKQPTEKTPEDSGATPVPADTTSQAK